MKLLSTLCCLGCFTLGGLLCDSAARAAAITNMSADEAADECMIAEICIDNYLWSLYQRTPKIDTVNVPETKTTLVTRKGRTRAVTTTVTKSVTEDFSWKDAQAAQRAGMSLKDYVIGGMDARFKTVLYHALHALDEMGLAPGITSGFRDDYRQSIATGHKARDDSSYHGGSRHGGYGHGLAADVVSVKGDTRGQHMTGSEELWKWIDANGKDYGVGRPYLDRDAPHVGPIDGVEYASHHGGAAVRVAAATNTEIRAITPHKARRLASNRDRRVVAKLRELKVVHVARIESQGRTVKAQPRLASTRTGRTRTPVPHRRIG